MALSDDTTATPKAKGAAPTAAPATEPELLVTLDNFCAELSQSDKRVETIGGFHFTERAAGRGKDTASAYRARFDAFATRAL